MHGIPCLVYSPFPKHVHFLVVGFRSEKCINARAYSRLTCGLLNTLHCSIFENSDMFVSQKPANILVMGEGSERGRVKIGV